MDCVLNRLKMATKIARTFVSMSAKGKQQQLKQKSGNPGRQGDMSGALAKSLADVLRPIKPPPPRSEEERKKLRVLMQRYGKLKQLQYVELEKRKREFMRAKWAAVDALPHKRRLEALYTKPEKSPPRPLFTHTPPIKGFNAGDLSKK